MITGFNTDIDFQGVTYHVQTEDKGLATPLILSLVYNRGTILASKRAPYDDLVKKGFDEKILTERLQKQHKIICAAIRAGRIEELKKMTAKESSSRSKQPAVDKTSEIRQTGVHPKPSSPAETEPKSEIDRKSAGSIQPVKISPEAQPVRTLSGGISRVSVYRGNESPIPKPRYDLSTKSAASVTDEPVSKRSKVEREKPLMQSAGDEPVIEAVEIIEDEMILPAEAVEIVTEIAPNKPGDRKLKLEILGDDVFRSGEKKTISILAYRGGRQSGSRDAQVMVKVLGAAFRPLIFHGQTDANGIAKVHLQMPLFKQGRAAILIKVISEGEEIELRRTIKHK